MVRSHPRSPEIYMETISELKIENKERPCLRILLAEDIEIIRISVKETLEARGYVVVDVSNGELLLDELLKEGQSYDLVITDKEMPLKTGIEVIREIRSNEKFSKLPIILMTGDFDPDGRLESSITKLGATYLEKPFAEEKLYSVIDKLILSPKPAE